MIKETIIPNSEKLVIYIPKEYVGKKLEVLVFSENEVQKVKNENEKLLEEFKKISKNISVLKDKNIDITKIDEEMYNDIL